MKLLWRENYTLPLSIRLLKQGTSRIRASSGISQCDKEKAESSSSPRELVFQFWVFVTGSHRRVLGGGNGDGQNHTWTGIVQLFLLLALYWKLTLCQDPENGLGRSWDLLVPFSWWPHWMRLHFVFFTRCLRMVTSYPVSAASAQAVTLTTAVTLFPSPSVFSDFSLWTFIVMLILSSTTSVFLPHKFLAITSTMFYVQKVLAVPHNVWL